MELFLNMTTRSHSGMTNFSWWNHYDFWKSTDWVFHDWEWLNWRKQEKSNQNQSEKLTVVLLTGALLGLDQTPVNSEERNLHNCCCSSSLTTNDDDWSLIMNDHFTITRRKQQPPKASCSSSRNHDSNSKLHSPLGLMDACQDTFLMWHKLINMSQSQAHHHTLISHSYQLSFTLILDSLLFSVRLMDDGSSRCWLEPPWLLPLLCPGVNVLFIPWIQMELHQQSSKGLRHDTPLSAATRQRLLCQTLPQRQQHTSCSRGRSAPQGSITVVFDSSVAEELISCGSIGSPHTACCVHTVLKTR